MIARHKAEADFDYQCTEDWSRFEWMDRSAFRQLDTYTVKQPHNVQENILLRTTPVYFGPETEPAFQIIQMLLGYRASIKYTERLKIKKRTNKMKPLYNSLQDRQPHEGFNENE